MKPEYFEGHNKVYAKDQEPYLPLPVFVHADSWSCVTSCWALTIPERIKVLFTGRVWVTMPTFGKALTPVKIQSDKPELI